MSLSETVGARKGIGKTWWMLIAVLAPIAPAHGQRIDVTPLIGYRTGGSIDVQQEGQSPQARAYLANSGTFGVAAGFHFFDEAGCEDCSVVEFRWTRQNTNLGFKETAPVVNPLAIGLGRPAVTLDHYMADFSWEWNGVEAKAVRPFVMASLGAAHLSTPASGSMRFSFGLGGGVKIFPQRHWGLRLQVEYLPMLMHSDVQRVVCAGGCVIALGGGLMNQFEFTFGPVLRF